MISGRDEDPEKSFAILILLALVAGALKILGGVIYSSRAVTVDAATSIGNIVSVLLISRFHRLSMRPPDKDHHYGHARLAFGGDLYTLMIYSFIAGLLTIDLVQSLGERYEISYEASVFAALGTILYALLIVLSKRIGRVVEFYWRLSFIEIIEGVVATLAALAGALISYLIDLGGGFALYTYLLVELFASSKRLISDISDRSSEEIERVIISILSEKKSIKLKELRVREIYDETYFSDIIVEIPSNMSIKEAHEIIDEIEKKLREKRIYANIHMEPM